MSGSAGASSAARMPQSGTGMILERWSFREISSRPRGNRGPLWPENTHRMWTSGEARLDVEGEPPAEETKDGVLGPDLLRTQGQCPHHFFIQARGVAQRKLSLAIL